MEQTKDKKKKKITLTTIGLVLLIVLAAANLYGWKAKANSEAQIGSLISEVSDVRAQTGNVLEPADDLESRLKEATDALAAAQAGFPETIDRNEVIDYILDVAGDCGVSILPLVSDGWSLQNIGQSYNVLVTNATAEGSLQAVNTFISTIQNGKYPTLTVPEYTIKRTSVDVVSPRETEIYITTSIRICIYTYTPGPEGGNK